jgi:hypothetical protein
LNGCSFIANEKGDSMKKYTALVLAALVSLLIGLAAADSGTTLSMTNAAIGSDPKSVPGSINRGNGAIVKPGYTFVRRGNEVDVVRARGFKTGTYVCSCRSGDPNKKCELIFSPKQILCKQGSCSGASCLLVPVEPAASQ